MDTLSKLVSDKILKEMNGIFPNASTRLRIWSDVDKFNWKEDEDIWKQKTGRVSKEYEIYFDREYLCMFSEDDSVDQAYLIFLNSLKRAYKEEKIYVNEQMYVIKDEEAKIKSEAQFQAEIEAIPKARNSQEEIVREVVVKTKKRKYGKR